MAGLSKVGDLIVLEACSSQHLGGCSVHGSSLVCAWQWPVSCSVSLGEGRPILHLQGRRGASSASGYSASGLSTVPSCILPDRVLSGCKP